jgi:hypothetical protein
MEEQFLVVCPYCGEDVEVYIELEMTGRFVQDCEVCCNPWSLRVVVDDAERYLEVSRADGSE